MDQLCPTGVQSIWILLPVNSKFYCCLGGEICGFCKNRMYFVLLFLSLLLQLIITEWFLICLIELFGCWRESPHHYRLLKSILEQEPANWFPGDTTPGVFLSLPFFLWTPRRTLPFSPFLSLSPPFCCWTDGLCSFIHKGYTNFDLALHSEPVSDRGGGMDWNRAEKVEAMWEVVLLARHLELHPPPPLWLSFLLLSSSGPRILSIMYECHNQRRSIFWPRTWGASAYSCTLDTKSWPSSLTNKNLRMQTSDFCWPTLNQGSCTLVYVRSVLLQIL